MAFYGNLSGATGRSSGSEEAKGIKYTDTMSIGGTNVQAVLDVLADKVLNGLLTKDEATQIIDSLDSTSTTAALSANQGRELYQKHNTNYGYIVGNQTRIDNVEKDITSLQGQIDNHTVNIVENINNISSLQLSVNNIKSELPEDRGGIVTCSNDMPICQVDGSCFQVTSNGIRLMTASTMSKIVGAIVRSIGNTVLTETPMILGRTCNLTYTTELFMNSMTLGIQGSSIVCLINGEQNGSCIDLYIRSASGNITLPSYCPIVLPVLDIFHA